MKYLTLIRSIALLHQCQREVKTLTHGGKLLRYIEVQPSDIALANELAQEVLGRTVDELLPQTRKLLTLLHGWVRTECERQGVDPADFHFTRRQAREATGWGDTQVWTHLGRLMELEFLRAHRGKNGQTYVFELLYQGEDAEGRARLLGLIDCASLQAPAQPAPTTPTFRGGEAHLLGGIRPPFGGDSGSIRGPFGGPESSADEPFGPVPAPAPVFGGTGAPARPPSYPAPRVAPFRRPTPAHQEVG